MVSVVSKALSSSSSSSHRWPRLLSAALLILGAEFFFLDLESIHTFFGLSDNALGSNTSSIRTKRLFAAGIDTTGIRLSHVIGGDPNACRDVIYTGGSRDPLAESQGDAHANIFKAWKSTAYLVNHSPSLKNGNTCYVVFEIPEPWNSGGLNPSWAPLPATAVVMDAFPNANVFLYMDPKDLLSFSDQSPTAMYEALAFDGYGEDPTLQHLRPGLIVNKPLTGWHCSQCENFGLGHGCFDTSTLLWHRANGAEPVLEAWWESRLLDESHNLVHPQTGDGFQGWTDPDGSKRLGNAVGPQNRLMYLFGAKDARVAGAVWPVPRQKSTNFDSESCPNGVDKGHTPCLLNNHARGIFWNTPSKLSCFVSHYGADSEVVEHTDLMMKERYEN